MSIKNLLTAAVAIGAVTAGSLGLASSAVAASAAGHWSSARADWKDGAHAVSAEQGRFWLAARQQLAAYGTRYAHERGDLKTLTSIPETSTTAKQRATALRVTRELNGFFRTPDLYGVSAGHPRKLARADWVRANHVIAAKQNGWLGAAKDELDAYGARFSSERADLTSLEAIPLTSTTAKQRATAHRDYRKLDAFFNTPNFG